MNRRHILFVFMLAAFVFFAPHNAFAKNPVNEWVKVKDHYCYYNADGERMTGLVKIGKNKYYFDEHGYQHTGWQKIKDYYCFFRRYNGKKGYLMKDCTINHIKIKKSGKASVGSSNKNRIYALVKAQELVETATVPSMKKYTKLKLSWDYFQKNYTYRGELKYKGGTNWEANYARNVFLLKKGNCYALGATFAFIASACGYEDSCAVSSGGHGWAEVNGRVFDPSWAKTDKKNNYFNMDMSLSGKNGRPNYKRARVYVNKI